MTVGNACELLYVEHGAARVAYRLAEEHARVRAEGGVNLFFRGIGADERHVDAELFHGDTEEVERSAVDFVGGNDVAACLADVEHCIEVRGLSA